MGIDDKVKILTKVESIVQELNSCMDLLKTTRVPVTISVLYQHRIDDVIQPILTTNSEYLIKKYQMENNPELDHNHMTAGTEGEY